MSDLARAIALYHAGNRDAATILATQVVAATPRNADALNLLAVLALDDHDPVGAEAFAHRAIAVGGEAPFVLNTLGNSLLAQGRSAEALEVLTRAQAAAPDEPDLIFNLANAQQKVGQLEAAAASYQRCIALKPGHVPAYNNLAVLMKAHGDVEGAASVLIEAVAHAPKSAELRFNLGNALHAAGRLDAAEAAFRRTIDLRSSHAEAHANLGAVLGEIGRKAEAEAMFRRAIALNPDLVPAYVGLADLVDDGSMDAVAHRRAVLDIKPDLAAIRSSLLMCLHYTPETSRAELFHEHLAYGAMFADAAPRKRAAARPLRLGVVSGDFRFHAMLFFALPVFAARDKAAWHLTCYSTTAKPDDHTASFRDAADAWRDVRALSAVHLAELIARDEIDILIDLSGHAPHNRLPTFALRPAPRQVAWGDYVDTRGLKTIDVLLGDAIHTPPEDDRYYTERVVRFAPDYICYQPPAYAPPVAPAPDTGGITFGCFSEVTKIGPTSVALWAAVLKAIPDARFLLNNHLLADDARQTKITRLFVDAGIGSERLLFRTGGSHEQFLAQYAEVDVILDTAPYSGGLTTCEALLMGVPVLTVPGDRFCGRHATAHLTHGGYPEGVAADVEGLVTKAKALASDQKARAALRADLRRRFQASTVCDVAGFAKAFYAALSAT